MSTYNLLGWEGEGEISLTGFGLLRVIWFLSLADVFNIFVIINNNYDWCYVT